MKWGGRRVFLTALFATIAGSVALLLLGWFLLTRLGNADCVWNGTAMAWDDADRNGLLDPGEHPLPNVAIHVDDVRNGLTDVALEASTGNDGRTPLAVWLPGCPRVQFEVYADAPSGYVATTPTRLQAGNNFLGTPETERMYLFGFRQGP